MVKILASGEIVPDNDPRVKQGPAATQRKPPRQESFGSQPATVSSANTSGTPSGAAPRGVAGPGNVGGIVHQENVLEGDLARALGIHGKSQHIFGYDVPLVYLLVGVTLACLWVSGNMNALRMLVFGFVIYTMYVSYQRAKEGGGAVGLGGFFGGMGGNPGDEQDNSSGGHVINRGN
mmetsp:Transcript_109251/g.216992  ORF Transcript_109251/g.216992 Transcript_109251/m.216992 type:complete len:177 (-) Transcript_109251:95-625(-)|eukprot:CAMPEP_0172719700 /NCGR_PEP_ID=MMETSP1074-20121228/75659_1 /TAXON_ID=2916 /ORGANISM="Ceratium fusus, Strain PA161109" /LENGTH=176 /DNA_ID=CAMNT_0013545087 /DNA_START=80 /DNA_END=610 /DNA_ORIENTATION=+